jgi:hypothetical protein
MVKPGPAAASAWARQVLAGRRQTTTERFMMSRISDLNVLIGVGVLILGLLGIAFLAGWVPGRDVAIERAALPLPEERERARASDEGELRFRLEHREKLRTVNRLFNGVVEILDLDRLAAADMDAALRGEDDIDLSSIDDALVESLEMVGEVLKGNSKQPISPQKIAADLSVYLETQLLLLASNKPRWRYILYDKLIDIRVFEVLMHCMAEFNRVVRANLEEEARTLKIYCDAQPNLLLIQIIRKAHEHDPLGFGLSAYSWFEDANPAFYRALREEFKAGTINVDQLFSLLYYRPPEVGLTPDPASIGTDSVGKQILMAIDIYREQIESDRRRLGLPPSSKEPPPERNKTESPPESLYKILPRRRKTSDLHRD